MLAIARFQDPTLRLHSLTVPLTPFDGSRPPSFSGVQSLRTVSTAVQGTRKSGHPRSIVSRGCRRSFPRRSSTMCTSAENMSYSFRHCEVCTARQPQCSKVRRPMNYRFSLTNVLYVGFIHVQVASIALETCYEIYQSWLGCISCADCTMGVSKVEQNGAQADDQPQLKDCQKSR